MPDRRNSKLQILFFSENWTDPTFNLHALHVLLLWVLQEDIRQVGARHQAFNVVRQMNHHAMMQQD